MAPKIISIINSKGGVSKTTTAVNLAYSLTLPECGNNNVLVVDLDYQYNASTALGISREEIKERDAKKEGIYRILTEKLPLAYDVVPTDFERLDIVPAMDMLKKAKQEITGQFDMNIRLKMCIEKSAPHFDIYDFIIIDCSPSLEVLEYNALMASDYVITPVKAGEFSFNGIIRLFASIAEVQQQNSKLTNLGAVITQVDVRSNREKEYRELYEAVDPSKIFTTYIDKNVAVERSQDEHQPVYVYDKDNKAANKYIELAYEVLLKINPNFSPEYEEEF